RRTFMLECGDDAGLEEVVLPLLVGVGGVHSDFGGVERGLLQVDAILRVAWIDLNEEVAGFDEGASLDGHLEDGPASLGLHFDDGDRLDDAGRLGVDDDIAVGHDRRLHYRRLALVARAGSRGKSQGRSEVSSHWGLSPGNSAG